MKVATLCHPTTDDAVLFLHRNKKENDMHKGYYIGLGGKLEEYESPLECVVREVLEETNVLISNPTLRGLLSFPVKEGYETPFHENWIVFLYEVENWEGKFQYATEGELVWVKKDQLDTLNLWAGDKIFLDLLLKTNKLFRADFVYEGDALVDHEVGFFS